MEKERTMKKDDGVDGGFVEVSTEQQNSTKISRNAKGGFAYEVKIYHDNRDRRNAETLAECQNVEKMIKQLEKDYPRE